MLRIVLILFAAIIGSAANAQYQSASSAVDPYAFGENVLSCGGGLYNCNRSFCSAAGKTVRNLAINTGIKNLVMIVGGQSNVEGVTPTAFTPTNASALDNLSICDGAIYAATESATSPLLGAAWAYQSISGTVSGNISLRIADLFVTNAKFDRVIIVPIASGGSTISQWDTGGILAGRPCAAVARLKARGITPQTNVTFAFLWAQGESDVSTTQAAYQAAFGRIANTLIACGFSGRIFVAKQTWASGVVLPTVQAAQLAVVDNVNIFAGPDSDSLGATNRQGDNTHYNDTGAAAVATLWYNAMRASGAPF